MNNFVYCDECHLVFFDVSCKKCPQCREGNLREVAVYIEPAAEQPLVLDVPCACPKFENGGKVFPMRECEGCRKSAHQ